MDTPLQKATKEWRKWERYCHPAYLPEMEPNRLMGAVDSEDRPKKPVYVLGKVIKRGKNLDNGLNHADYVCSNGCYDLLR